LRPFETIESAVTPLPRINVDTDQIVPKQFLRLVQRSGFGRHLFHGWRYGEDGVTPMASFPLNDPRYAGSRILVTGENFGCGSSREHAVWALMDYGFGAVIAPSFADIFASNCIKSGLLPAALPREAVERLMRTTAPVRVDLEARRVSVPSEQASWGFEIGDHARRTLLEGLDEIALTLEREGRIAEYERANPVPAP